jgi:hypothetical protein
MKFSQARAIGKQAFAQRLKEIDMSAHDADAYGKLRERIAKQISLLKVVIDGLQARSGERQWLRHQTTGDVDEAKLIEGVR